MEDQKKAKQYFLEGVTLFKKGDLDDAVVALTHCIEEDPDYTEAYFVRGNVFGRQKEYDKAMSDFTKVLEKDPKHTGAIHGRAVAFSLKEAEEGRAKIRSEYKEELDKQNEKFKDEMSKMLQSFEDDFRSKIGLDTDEFRDLYKSYRERATKYDQAFFVIMALSLIALGGYAWVIREEVWPYVLDEKNPYLVLPWLLVAGVVFSPIVALVRAINRRRHEALTLALEFQRKAVVGERYTAYGPSIYVEHWMENSPVEVLATLRNDQKSKPTVPSLAERFAPKED